jgi:hypothetical protein
MKRPIDEWGLANKCALNYRIGMRRGTKRFFDLSFHRNDGQQLWKAR